MSGSIAQRQSIGPRIWRSTVGRKARQARSLAAWTFRRAYRHLRHDLDVDLAKLCKFERVRQKVFKNLSQAFDVGLNAFRQSVLKLDDEIEAYVIEKIAATEL